MQLHFTPSDGYRPHSGQEQLRRRHRRKKLVDAALAWICVCLFSAFCLMFATNMLGGADRMSPSADSELEDKFELGDNQEDNVSQVVSSAESPVYSGGYEMRYISREYSAPSSILKAKDAEVLLDGMLPTEIGIIYDRTIERDDAMTEYVFLQRYGPLPVFSCEMTVTVDQWGNWKKIEGDYALLDGSITPTTLPNADDGQLGIVLSDGLGVTCIKQQDGSLTPVQIADDDD